MDDVPEEDKSLRWYSIMIGAPGANMPAMWFGIVLARCRFVRCSYTKHVNALFRVCTVAKGLGVVEIGHDKKGFSRARNRGSAAGRGGGSGARGTGNGHGTCSYFDIVTVRNRILLDRFHALPFHVRNQRPNGIRDDYRRRYQAALGAVRHRTNSHAGQGVRVVANGAIQYRTSADRL
jgi:hypothetical protein